MKCFWFGLALLCLTQALHMKRQGDKSQPVSESFKTQLYHVAVMTAVLASHTYEYLRKAGYEGISTDEMREMVNVYYKEYQKLKNAMGFLQDQAAEEGINTKLEIDRNTVLKALRSITAESQGILKETDVEYILEDPVGDIEDDSQRLVTSFTMLKLIANNISSVITNDLFIAVTQTQLQAVIDRIMTGVEAFLIVAEAISETANDAELLVNEELVGANKRNQRDSDVTSDGDRSDRQRRQFLNPNRFGPRPGPPPPRLPGAGSNRFNFKFRGNQGGFKNPFKWTNPSGTTTWEVIPNPFKPEVKFTWRF